MSPLLTKLVKLLKRVFCFCSRNEFHEASILPLPTIGVFKHCSRPECSRNEFITREQTSLKYFIVRWGVHFSTCAITNAQFSTAMITQSFVLEFWKFCWAQANEWRKVNDVGKPEQVIPTKLRTLVSKPTSEPASKAKHNNLKLNRKQAIGNQNEQTQQTI